MVQIKQLSGQAVGPELEAKRAQAHVGQLRWCM